MAFHEKSIIKREFKYDNWHYHVFILFISMFNCYFILGF